ncbi:VanZ family protein [Bacillus sp. BGMRC 2118]|nr:VanZ family protein [Bacillus sp. BGMRC 2118]
MIRNEKLLAGTAFLMYVCFLFYLVFFSSYRHNVQGIFAYNVVPFESISAYVHHYDGFRITRLTDNFFGNIAAFIPFGILIPCMIKSVKLLQVTLYSILFSLFIEVTQIFLRVGAFDVDDILLNTVGGIFGYVLLRSLVSIYNLKDK